MTQRPAADTVPVSADDDHAIIQAFLNSDKWEEQLRIARLKREKVFADRALAGAVALVLLTVPILRPEAQASAPVVAPEPDGAKRFAAPMARAFVGRGRILRGLAIGLAAGLIVGFLLRPVAEDTFDSVASSSSTMTDHGLDGAGRPTDPDPAMSATLAFSGIIDPAAPVPPQATASEPFPPIVDRTSGRAPDRLLLPQVTAIVPQLAAWAASDELAADMPSRLGTDVPPSRSGVMTSALGDGGDADLPVEILSPVPWQIAGLASAQPTSLRLPVMSTQSPSAGILPDTAEPVPRVLNATLSKLALPAGPDATFGTADTPYIERIEGYRINLHLARADRGTAVRDRLVRLGLVDVVRIASPFEIAQNMVAFYRPEDAEAAHTLAKVFDGTVMDLVGFSPVPAAPTIEVYLRD